MDVKKFYGKRFHNLSAATDYIESSDRSHFDFAIIPPNTHWDTNEEDIEEDNILRDDIPRDVPGEVDLFLSSDSDSDDDIPLASLQKRQTLSKDLNPKWRKRITSAEIPETRFYEQSQLEACSLW
ncbi:uncharacterized protein LOC128857949 [Anastrepha ludens]|uniref:uncharacterized protein LOC128857949 n=1 Tax=Anastrepha ludens TaxID=28586 RepID=UPI0023AEC50D|nr:uncharacterized protein LOC128857949 [Anastrepha ludens]